MKSIQQHRHDAIHPIPTVPLQADIIKGLEKLYTRVELALVVQMLQNRKKHTNEFWKPRYLPPAIDPKQVYPSTSELIKRSAFGKPNILRTYTVIPAFSHILLPVLKHDYLTKSDLKNFFKVMPAAQYLHGRILALKQIDFRALRPPNFDWEAKEVYTDRQLLQEAAILHYNGWYPALQLYCGGRNTGAQRRVQQMLITTRYILQDATFTQHLPRASSMVCPIFWMRKFHPQNITRTKSWQHSLIYGKPPSL
jgi:hypothetical protein